MPKNEPACYGCGYLAFDGLKKGCFHPENIKHLTAAPAKCGMKRASDDKSGDPRNPKRLSLQEFRKNVAETTTRNA